MSPRDGSAQHLAGRSTAGAGEAPHIKWIERTSRISVDTVEPAAVTLNGVTGAWGEMQAAETLMVKFSRPDLIPTLMPNEENIVVVGGAIDGSDSIMVIDRGGKGKK